MLTPSDVIARRPDVQAAQRRLIAAAEQRNVAAALRYPRITLAGLLGIEDDRVEDLLDSGTHTYSVSAGWLAPLIAAQATADVSIRLVNVYQSLGPMALS